MYASSEKMFDDAEVERICLWAGSDMTSPLRLSTTFEHGQFLIRSEVTGELVAELDWPEQVEDFLMEALRKLEDA